MDGNYRDRQCAFMMEWFDRNLHPETSRIFVWDEQTGLAKLCWREWVGETTAGKRPAVVLRSFKMAPEPWTVLPRRSAFAFGIQRIRKRLGLAGLGTFCDYLTFHPFHPFLQLEYSNVVCHGRSKCSKFCFWGLDLGEYFLPVLSSGILGKGVLVKRTGRPHQTGTSHCGWHRTWCCATHWTARAAEWGGCAVCHCSNFSRLQRTKIAKMNHNLSRELQWFIFGTFFSPMVSCMFFYFVRWLSRNLQQYLPLLKLTWAVWSTMDSPTNPTHTQSAQDRNYAAVGVVAPLPEGWRG